MTITLNNFDSYVTANTLATFMIITINDSDEEYFTIKDITKVKSGMYGASKVLASVKNVKTGNIKNLSFTGSEKIHVVEPVKKKYQLVEIDKNNNYIDVNSLSKFESAKKVSLNMNDIDSKSVQDLEKAKNALNKDRYNLIFTLVSYPKLVMIEDITEEPKKSMNNKK